MTPWSILTTTSRRHPSGVSASSRCNLLAMAGLLRYPTGIALHVFEGEFSG